MLSTVYFLLSTRPIPLDPTRGIGVRLLGPIARAEVRLLRVFDAQVDVGRQVIQHLGQRYLALAGADEALVGDVGPVVDLDVREAGQVLRCQPRWCVAGA